MGRSKKQDTDLISTVRYNTVIKANSLIQRSRFSLSTQQQKIVLYIISMIEPEDEDFKLYEFKITEFCKVCGIDSQSDIYNILRTQIKTISDKSLWIELEDGTETIVRWIEKPYIDKHSGTIKIKLDNDMKPYLLQLKEKFTKYELIYTLNFKSKYSIRLYEYLKSIHYHKLKPYTKTIPIDKFKLLLDNPYDDFKNFHTRVLQPAQKEINAYSDIIFNYELLRQGRKVVSITITIESKDIVERMRLCSENNRMLDDKGGSIDE